MEKSDALNERSLEIYMVLCEVCPSVIKLVFG
jgi:hypothetical protein